MKPTDSLNCCGCWIWSVFGRFCVSWFIFFSIFFILLYPASFLLSFWNENCLWYVLDSGVFRILQFFQSFCEKVFEMFGKVFNYLIGSNLSKKALPVSFTNRSFFFHFSSHQTIHFQSRNTENALNLLFTPMIS